VRGTSVPGSSPAISPIDTGNTLTDAQSDFARARRHSTLADVAHRLRRHSPDYNVILPFEEVVEALGRTWEKQLGLDTIELDSIVGTVDRRKDFDRGFRPTSDRTRPRWERIAMAQRRGEDMPPISVYRIGDLHFVRDGHHRVSVARALGRDVIDAYVTEVGTKIGAGRSLTLSELPLKGHERVFFERVPLPPDRRARLKLTDPWRYAELAEGVEAWGFRLIQRRGEVLSREEVARTWFDEEYLPIVAMLREAGLLGSGTEAEAYLRVSGERYRLLRTHTWNEEIIERVKPELR
jgi:hypothetical protein